MRSKTHPSKELVEVLIAADSPTQAEQLRHLLEQHRYRATVANNGKQALALLGEHTPAVVITDTVMPEMNGFELCQRIKADERLRDIPVILLTALTTSEDVFEGLASGGDSFITKPYSEEYLLANLQQILANRRLRKGERVRIGVEICLAGKKRLITADQQQMLTLLISTYEAAIHRNAELIGTHAELRSLNARLEDMVEERTAALAAEIAERKQAEEREGLARKVLEFLNRPSGAAAIIGDILRLVKTSMDFEAAGIRLQEGDDYPYFEASGFSEDFLRAERYLCERDEAGNIVRDGTGNPVLDCMCGNILRGRTDPKLPFFTEGGSFWTNNTTQLLASTTEEDRQARTRNRCSGEGYESVALIPLRSGGEIIGLLQLNDHRPNRFTLELIHYFEGLGASIGIALARKRVEESLQKERKRLYEVLETLPAMICLLTPDYHVAFANRSFREKFGESHGRHCYDYCFGRTEPCEFCEAYNVLKTGKPHHWEVTGPDGGSIIDAYDFPFTDVDGSPLILEMDIDITERKRTEENADRVGREWQRTFNATNSAIWILDRDRRVVRFNKTSERFFGRSCDELIGKHCCEIVHGTDAPISECPLLRARESLQRETQELQVGQGWYEIAVDPMLDANGQYDGAVHMINDITERRSLQEQLHQSQKMEAIGQLAGGVAHDFNNILQAIVSYSCILLDRLPEHDEKREFAEEIAQGAERASALTRQLLAFSRRQILEMGDLDLNDAVRDLTKMTRRTIGEDVEVEVMEGRCLDIVHADRGQMEQVLLNLCVNARDAMPEGGALTIETENVVMDKEYCDTHAWASPGRYVLLSVTDTGCGMDAQTQARIFEPFFTTKQLDKGTGLGLATVYGIVRQHQGMIQVYSEVGKGTTFKVYLPSVERTASTVGTRVIGRARGGTETVLVAEDDQTLRKLAARILESARYTVLLAADGKEALDVFEKHTADIDLLFLDVVMPKMGGKAVYDLLRRQHPRLRFLFSSGYRSNAIHTEFVLKAGIDLIQKPYAPDALLRKVREVLDQTG
jgi:PAS domain S-box-containing protein